MYLLRLMMRVMLHEIISSLTKESLVAVCL